MNVTDHYRVTDEMANHCLNLHSGKCTNHLTLDNRLEGRGEHPNSYTDTNVCYLLRCYDFCILNNPFFKNYKIGD